jgi:predicted TIM-barrel fold metal-dependent hydrolase
MTPANGWTDVHAHFTPPSTAQDRQTQWRALQDAHFLSPEPYHWTPENALATMDRLGIAMQLLSPIPLSTALPEVRRWNDYGAQLVADHPSRFGLLAGLPTGETDAALQEIERGGHGDAPGRLPAHDPARWRTAGR